MSSHTLIPRYGRLVVGSAALCLHLLAGTTLAQEPAAPQRNGLENRILEASKEWFGALMAGDVEALDRLQTDDFLTIQQGRGAVVIVGKTRQLENMRKAVEGQPRFDRELSAVNVREYGNVVVLTALATYRQPGPRRTGPAGQSVVTEIWVNENGRWRIAHFQPTDVPNSKPAK